MSCNNTIKYGFAMRGLFIHSVFCLDDKRNIALKQHYKAWKVKKENAKQELYFTGETSTDTMALLKVFILCYNIEFHSNNCVRMNS
jgi:hypothetical protein